MFDFDKLDRLDLEEGPTKVNTEGERSLLTHRWVWMAVFIFILGTIFRNTALIGITAFMLSAVAFCWLWSRVVLAEVTYQRRFHHKRAFPGEDVEASIVVENKKLIPVTWLQIEDEWPVAFGPSDDALLTPSPVPQMSYMVNVYSLRWNERVRRKYLLTARERGIFATGPAHVISGDPFSLFEKGMRFDRSDFLIVYPKVRPLEEFGLDPKEPFGDLRTAQYMFEDPNWTMGVRDYRSGDSYRSIHWKATARTHALQVRQYEPRRSMSFALCLNIASFEYHWQGTWPEMVEHLIGVAASIASWGLENQYSVGIAANATLAQADRSILDQPNRGRDHLMHLLELLAGISYFITREYQDFILEESTRLPWGATLILITGFVNEAILASVLQLRANGRRVILVNVGKDKPPNVEGIQVYHLPLSDNRPEKPTVKRLSSYGGEPETARQRYLREKQEQAERATH